MQEIQQTERKRGISRFNGVGYRVDFTPMVDMNMLLLTFFMLATSLFKPNSMKINMPTNEITQHPTVLTASKAVTLYLGKDHQIYYFFGEPNVKTSNFLSKTNFSPAGLRTLLFENNAVPIKMLSELETHKRNMEISREQLESEIKKIKDDSPVVLIKPLDNSTYDDMVKALNEMLVTDISRYMIARLDANDKIMLKKSGVLLN